MRARFEEQWGKGQVGHMHIPWTIVTIESMNQMTL